MEEDIIKLKAESLTLTTERKKKFDCSNLFSILGVIGMVVLLKAMFA